jgi:type IX secretion system PorP/SprF family membrane protein
MKRLVLTLSFILSVLTTFAQQDALYTQYMFNGLILNPAYAGNKGLLNVNLINRIQWGSQKIIGPPRTQAFTADGIFDDGRIGLGLHVINDQVGAQKQLSVMGSYAYKLPIGEETQLSFGLSAGVSNYVLDGTALTYTDQYDDAIPATNISNLTPDFNFGVYLSHDKYYVGLSTTHLLTLKHKDHFADYINLNRHYFFNAGYIWTLNDMLKIYPSTLVRTDLKGPTDIDINASLLLNDKFGFGGTYRTSAGKNFASNSAVAMMQIYMFEQKLRLGYSYDFDIAKYGVPRNSHEISIGYVISSKRDWRTDSSPRYY